MKSDISSLVLVVLLIVFLLHLKGRQIKKGKKIMAIDHDAMQADLQEVANKHQAHLLVTATPVDTADEKFDVTAVANS